MLEKLFIRLLRHAAALMNFRNHYARIDRVDADSVRSDFERGTACQLVQTRFRNAVSQYSGK